MNHKILVPFDGSELAGKAIPWADAWAGALEAEVKVLRVTHVSGMPMANSDERENLEIEQGLAAAARRFKRAQSVETVHLDGFAVDTIVAQAEEMGATLIVMATHGRGGFTRTLMGSVASAVVHRTRVPLLAVRSDLALRPSEPGKVLVPIDPSDLETGITPYLLSLAQDLGLVVCLYWVARYDVPNYGETARQIGALAARIQSEQVKVEVQIERGPSPAGAITELVARGGFGFIAINTRGRTGFGGGPFGSVTDWVVRHATIPVLVIRPQGSGVDALEPSQLPGLTESATRVHIEMSIEHARVTRLALENLASSANRRDRMVQQVHDALRVLDSAVEDAAA